MKAIILARVSTDEQKEANNSLPAQIHRMRSYCESNNLEIKKEYSWSESAYKVKRDEFDSILEDIEKSKEKLIICFDRVDRLSRNIFDKRVAFLYEKAIAGIIELHFISDGQVINDKMNAGDKFMFGIKLGLAKYYSDAISDNVKKVAEERRRSGKRVGGMAPLGYLNIINEDEKKTITINPENSHLIQKIFELYATGNYSLKALIVEAEKIGLKSRKGNIISMSVVQRLLQNPFYYGVQTSEKYKPYPHIYTKLISKDLFDKCQEVMKGRSNNKTKVVSQPFIFKGFLKCDNCGCSITPELHKKKSGKEFIYYSCTNGKGVCKREYLNEKTLLEPIYELLDSLSNIDEEIQEHIKKKLRETSELEVIYHKKQIKRIQSEYNKVDVRKENLTDMRLDNSITKEEYDKKLSSMKQKQGLLQIELEEHTKADYDFLTTVSIVFSLARRAREIFDSSEIDEKRQLLNYLLQNPVIKSKKLYFTTKKPFDMLLNIPRVPVLGGYSL